MKLYPPYLNYKHRNKTLKDSEAVQESLSAALAKCTEFDKELILRHDIPVILDALANIRIDDKFIAVTRLSRASILGVFQKLVCVGYANNNSFVLGGLTPCASEIMFAAVRGYGATAKSPAAHCAADTWFIRVSKKDPRLNPEAKNLDVFGNDVFPDIIWEVVQEREN